MRDSNLYLFIRLFDCYVSIIVQILQDCMVWAGIVLLRSYGLFSLLRMGVQTLSEATIIDVQETFYASLCYRHDENS